MRRISKTTRRRGSGQQGRRQPAPDRKPQPKPSLTKQLVIEAAEKLYGKHGLDGISLREIALAAGQANSNVVQYHFRDKDGLITAILSDRLERIEAVRRNGLAALAASGKPGPRELLKILWLPLMLIRDDEGNHTFCRFMLQYMIQPRLSKYPLFTHLYNRPLNEKVRRELGVVRTTELLHAHYAALRPAVFSRRLTALSMMFQTTVIEHDNARLHGSWRVPAEFDADPVIDMAIGALSVPDRR